MMLITPKPTPLLSNLTMIGNLSYIQILVFGLLIYWLFFGRSKKKDSKGLTSSSIAAFLFLKD